MNAVNRRIPKLDARALTTGKGVYTDDLIPPGALTVKVLRSPHPFARVMAVRADAARRLNGIACVLTADDLPKIRFTQAGQSYPEPSPYDRYILEDLVRYVGDPVAIVAGESEQVVDQALRMIRVDYQQLDPVLDYETALDHPSVVHPEQDYFNNFPVGGDPQRNLVASGERSGGDLERVFSECDVVVEETFHTKAVAQAMMETFRTYTWLDHNNRLNVLTSTQIPFHCRRQIARALGIPQSRVRVVKPRIGGGFGAKQTMCSELFPAVVTMKTGRPARMAFTRQESFTGSNSRHEMRVTVRMGADKDGRVRAIDMYALSNQGAYGEHGPTTIGLVGGKSIALYTPEAFRFRYDVVYTNTMGAGAFRGYGATQGCFALESLANRLAGRLEIDPVELRLRNIPKVGDPMEAYGDGALASSRLEDCIRRGRELIGWEEKFPSVRVDGHTVRGVGMAISMQGSGIANIDTCSAVIRLNDNGFYTLMIGATDMGTGCDTILAQIAAEVLHCPVSRVTVDGVDTDHSPFDKGSYASGTTYLTGMAVVKASTKLAAEIRQQGANRLGVPVLQVMFDGEQVVSKTDPDLKISLSDLAQQLVVGDGEWLQCTATHSSPVSPPPLMAGFAEVEVDTETGKVSVVDYVAVVDCGTVVNPNLATVQTQGGVAQGIGMALWEDIQYNAHGRMLNDSFMQYKIPSRLDLPDIRVEFMPSYEPTGPFGAKSIGEIVINTPGPAIAAAVANAVGVWCSELPIKPEMLI
ncbi:MAG: molybdopterin-dependent oxidoreductase [Anaerotruncus sp.]|nr:molybdopterin-dependent oxidoreductase [Anaerotruncus sp.]